MTKVLDHGHVILERHSGSDLDIVNAARVSLGAKSTWFEHIEAVGDEYVTAYRCLKVKDEGLINFLMRERHGSPFEHVTFSFNIKAPIFVVREWQRHRVGHSYNEMSGRYTELKPEFYVPKSWRVQCGKPGAYHFEDLVGSIVCDDAWKHAEWAYDQAWRAYTKMLDDGIAKEQARIVLPVGIYTQMVWTCNARSLMHWLGLRNSDQAQFEIREFAKEVEAQFATILPVTYRAFLDNDRRSP